MPNLKISQLTAGAPAQATDLVPVARAGTNVSLQVSDLLTTPPITGAVTITDNNIGSNFPTAFTSGLLLKNNTASTVGLTQDPPGIEFDGSYFDGSTSQPSQVAITKHHSNPLNIEVLDFLNTTVPKGGTVPIGFLVEIVNTAPATAAYNTQGTEISLVGRTWNGAASIADMWNFTTQTGAGANPTNNLLVQHKGSTGATVLDLTNSTGTQLMTVQVSSGFVIGTNGQTLNVGSGSPNGVVTAPVGSLYLNFTGTTNTTLWVKESTAGNTGWVAK